MAYYVVSDPHIDHAENLNGFLRALRDCTTKDDVVMVTGDISTSRYLEAHVELVNDNTEAKLLYVLGNHDYWGSSIDAVTRSLAHHDGTNDKLPTFMDVVDLHKMDDRTCIVGESAWYDGRLGQQGDPTFIMNDWYKMEDFYDASERSVRQICASIADASAARLLTKLRNAKVAGYDRIIVMTHCPTHEDSCMHLGRPSDVYALPWFSSKVVGDVIDQFASENSNVMLEVVCGHTHSPCRVRVSSNVAVTVTGATYGSPKIVDWTPTLW